MKKILSIIVIVVAFIVIYFLQSNFFNWFNIFGIKPNLFIMLALFVGIYIGKIYGLSIGIALGILLDFFIGKTIGINAIALGVAGVLGGVFAKSVSKDSRITIMLMMFGATIVCETISYLIQIIIYKLSVDLVGFLRIILIETIYNIILTIVLYPLIYKLGIILENNFSKDKILTRYY